MIFTKQQIDIFFSLRSIKIVVLLVISQVLFFSCNRVTKTRTEHVPQVPETLRIVCRNDSLQLVTFLNKLLHDTIQRERILSFYRSRNYSPVWINASGVNENAGNLINFLYNEKACCFQESVPSLDNLQQLHQAVVGNISGRLYCEDSLALQLEVLLTKSFFEFAECNWGGVDSKILKQANWFIARKQLNYDQLLNDYLHAGKDISPIEPMYGQYELLKSYLRKYNAAALKKEWPLLSAGNMTLKRADTSAIVISIKQLLFITGDMAGADSSAIFDSILESAVKVFQKRHGLKEDGIVNKRTLQTMCIPIQERIRTILINMERCRWVPVQLSGDYLVVNIPEFRLHVYRNERHVWSCKVIVGKSDPLNHTVIFNDSLEFIVFNPNWNIPKNILKKEILPAIIKDAGYILKNNLEVTDMAGQVMNASTIKWTSYTDHFPYLIRQKPGADNPLGNMKFLFPNPYDIYIHDTPSKNLFNETDRGFSHGCIRLEQPLRLAEFLLETDTIWTPEAISSVMEGGKETFVKLKQRTPIFIAYFTCWVDGAGRLNFRNDIYGHDEKMEKLLFVN
ncbi:L,D-transpeptidase family protein [Aurantibacillus circumpalustris]|uniref:L,D-transpeptidase family protein n=1 Tax=Aurantibacillus circumpalustris TaxID=3036359 RepID=UPI00295AF32C|nr:L,D-transpeptidase family protein [Aurantibacillus circumpalustris]